MDQAREFGAKTTKSRSMGFGKFKSGRDGLSLAEVLIAIVILSMVLLSLIAVLGSSLKADRKAFWMTGAANLADSELDRLLQSVRTDQPAGTREQFWDSDHPRSGEPLRSGVVTVSHTEYSFAIYSQTVLDTSGVPVGDPDHRLKQVDIVVRWHQSTTLKLGQGETTYHQRRLFSEVNVDRESDD